MDKRLKRKAALNATGNGVEITLIMHYYLTKPKDAKVDFEVFKKDCLDYILDEPEEINIFYRDDNDLSYAELIKAEAEKFFGEKVQLNLVQNKEAFNI